MCWPGSGEPRWVLCMGRQVWVRGHRQVGVRGHVQVAMDMHVSMGECMQALVKVWVGTMCQRACVGVDWWGGRSSITCNLFDGIPSGCSMAGYDYLICSFLFVCSFSLLLIMFHY